MGFLRNITALLLVILIANPLCCCFGQADPADEEPVHSCCSQPAPAAKEAPSERPCPGCQAKNPRLADGGAQFIISVEFFEIPSFSAARSDLRGLTGDSQGLGLKPIAPAPPPPRRRIALQQRYLI